MDINELRLMQNYPLELKIMKTKLRIEEWVSEYGADGVYVAFSGGKDSTVLLISEKCCNYLKKYPMQDYEKQSGKKPIIGTQASESKMRESAYLQTGCNNFKGGKCQPLGFWTEQDVLEYIYKFNLEIASVYGEVILEDGKYRTTGEARTGCVACGYGCSMWRSDEDNRYLRLEQTHPKLHNHVINNLGFKEVLDYMNIKYMNKEDLKIKKEKVKLGSNEVEQFKWII